MVSLQIKIATAPGRVFDAWINPAIMQQWLFVGETSRILEIKTHLELEGTFSIQEHEQTTDEYIDHYGQYLEIDPPQKLVFTLSVPKHFPGETIVTLYFFETTGGTLLNFTQTGVPPEVTEDSWKKMLGKLKQLLEHG